MSFSGRALLFDLSGNLRALEGALLVHGVRLYKRPFRVLHCRAQLPFVWN